MADDSAASSDLRQRTKHLSLRALKLCRSLPETVEGQVIRRQLARSATSVGANYRAAQRARSAKEFVAKLGIVEEEADETCFWLEIVIEDKMLRSSLVAPLLQECNEILAMTIASIRSARKRSTN